MKNCYCDQIGREDKHSCGWYTYDGKCTRDDDDPVVKPIKQTIKMENKNDGLHNKYIISKADGSKMDKNAQYFVLRIDLNGAGEDKETLSHRIACRAALREYASRIKETHLQLSFDILEKLIESD